MIWRKRNRIELQPRLELGLQTEGDISHIRHHNQAESGLTSAHPFQDVVQEVLGTEELVDFVQDDQVDAIC